MSVFGHLALVDELTWRRLLDDPSRLDAVIDDAYDADADRSVDVDRAWHALHFLLTGTAWEGEPPLDFIVRGGTEVGDDQGDGPARLLAPAEVARLAAALELVGADQLAARFDGRRMEELEIYPTGGWDAIEPSVPASFGYFSGAYEALRALVRRGRELGHALLIWRG